MLEVTSNKNNKKPLIDIGNFIDSKSLDANKLFELSVSNKSHELASLAWKISVQQNQSELKSVNTTVKSFSPKLKHKSSNLEDIIEHLNKSTNYASLGVALLLNATRETEWVTLRETATNVVNNILVKKPNGHASRFLRGFEWNIEKQKYLPVDLSSGRERKNTFHVSPLYIALREGLLYCKENGLVEQKKLLSVGALYTKNSDPSSDATRRIYYKVKASDRGRDLTSLWADLDRYIEKVMEVQ